MKLSRKKLINDRFMGHSILHLKLEAYDLRTYLKDHDDMNYSARPPTSSRPLKIPLDYPIKSLIKTNFYALNERQWPLYWEIFRPHQDYAPLNFGAKLYQLAAEKVIFIHCDATVPEGGGHLTTLLGTAWLQHERPMSSLLDVDKT